MRIANPIYDAVFKFLLEDRDIARELLSVILGEEITSLELKPQETAVQTAVVGINILRYDFKAVIRLPGGAFKKVLIELQKAKHLLDIMRFRRYLADNYRKTDHYEDEGGPQNAPLDIVTVYFLGFRLDNVPYAVLKANNCYQDALSGKFLDKKVDEPFVNLLDHEGFFIQIPRLEATMQTRLERVLQVFSQRHITDDVHELEYSGPTDDPLIEKMLHRLQFAIADEQLRLQIEAEEEVENLFLQKEREVQVAREQIRQQGQQLEAYRKKLLDLGINPDSL